MTRNKNKKQYNYKSKKITLQKKRNKYKNKQIYFTNKSIRIWSQILIFINFTSLLLANKREIKCLKKQTNMKNILNVAKKYHKICYLNLNQSLLRNVRPNQQISCGKTAFNHGKKVYY